MDSLFGTELTCAMTGAELAWRHPHPCPRAMVVAELTQRRPRLLARAMVGAERSQGRRHH